jgi:hypothetical protein
MPPNAKNNGFNGVVTHLNTMGGLLNQMKGKLTGYNTAAKNAANVGAYGHQNITTAINANRNAKLKNLTKNVKKSNITNVKKSNITGPTSLNNNSAHPEASNENNLKPGNEGYVAQQAAKINAKKGGRRSRKHRKHTRRH